MTDIIHSDSTIPTLIIRPPKKWVPVDFHEILRVSRTALQFCLPRCEDPVQTDALGFLWAIIQSRFMMIIFPRFFGGFAKIPSDVRG